MKYMRCGWVVVAIVLAAACTSQPSGATASEPQAAAPASAPKAPAFPVDPVYDEVASFLAGRPCGASPYKEFQETEEYKAYVTALDQSWAAMDAERLGPIAKWAPQEMPEAEAATTTVFYPFGGPDALTSIVLFPGAVRHLLLGLEFVGRMPEFKAGESSSAVRYIQNLQAALGDFINKSYFITHRMDETLTGDKVDGVLPLLCFFLKRSNHTISSIKRLELTATGEAVESPYPGETKKFRRPYGVRIAYFAEGTETLRELTYFSCDLEDKAFPKGKLLSAYLETVPFETTFVKSASYLMHYKEFSGIRDLILTKSRFILEDDTGIPYKYFPANVWDVRMYGTFLPPVSDFKGVDQPDLRKVFEEPDRAKPLPFPLGYHWGTKKDALLYIVKK